MIRYQQNYAKEFLMDILFSGRKRSTQIEELPQTVVKTEKVDDSQGYKKLIFFTIVKAE